MKVKTLLILLFCGVLVPSIASQQENIGHTEILKWQDGKVAALSITYDGGTINQFKVALPIMNELGLKATFFIVTGDITGSQYQGQFIGRPVEEILKETITVPLSPDNFLERATAVRFMGYEGTPAHHTRAGDFFELRKFGEAYSEIDAAYWKVRRGEYQPLAKPFDNETVDISWDELREIAKQGHEFASHSISHPQFAICDDANMKYELEKSKEELLNQLGPQHTFSHECPHGSENPRVIEFSLATYPALRNRMPEKYLEEINRWTRKDPGASSREYVQWQRGPKTITTLEEMKSWVDTCLQHDNIWLVLVFHGVDGIGYQPKTGEELKEYFNYMKSWEDRLWIATFQDATKYMRERMNSKVASSLNENTIQVTLTHTLDPDLYNHPLTVKTYVPSGWKSVRVKQEEQVEVVRPGNDEKGCFVTYSALPNIEAITLFEE